MLPERFRSAAFEKQDAIKVGDELAAQEKRKGSLKGITGWKQGGVSSEGSVEDVESDILERTR